MGLFRIALAFIKRDFLLAMSYRGAFAMQLAVILAAVPVLYFFSKAFGGGSAWIAGYGGDYFSYVLLGIAFQDYVTLSQSSFNTSIREHQLMGTLEIVMLSPTPMAAILIFSSLWGYIFTSLRFAAFIVIGVFFGLNLGKADPVSFFMITVASIASFSALGILSASVTILIKRGEVMNMILTGATVVLSGVVYPVEVLPRPLKWASNLLPFTHALEGIRKAVLLGEGPSSVLREFAVLALFGAILLPLGLFVFNMAVNRARRTGTLGQY